MSFVKRLRHRFEYAVFLVIAFLARALPIETASRWSGAGWRLVAPRLRRHRRAVQNLKAAFPEKSPAEIQALALAMWENLGRTFAEFFHLDEIVNSGRISFEQPELFAAIRARGGGSVACSLHMANWEIVSQAGAPLGWRPAGVYQKINNPFVDRYVKAVRAPLYPGGLSEKSPQIARIMLRYARDSGCASLLADQRDSKGIPAPFFGRPAPSTPFPASVARAVGVPLYAFRVKRVGGARFSIRIEEVATPQTEDRHADVAVATRNLQATFEAMIRESPEQWMWVHRRWE
jgi:Kdo2-lipid IVA lauroyltransferase/acyltransferase